MLYLSVVEISFRFVTWKFAIQNIYIILYHFKVNPYAEDPSFPDKTSPNRIVNPDIKMAGSLTKMN